uniref:NADH-ubiquinone oxidoreductase chain 1 n=1 Tax=Elateroidea sp. 2 KM-2017 TaxID=2219425 RepID=A0A346RG90_9COLE|nr:NADH dehydrogenase subunit 1 [Elateroidea sp. 2 KM-2017]
MFMMDYFSVIIVYLVMIIFVLVGVSFFVLMERKVLGYVHVRKGPNKVGYLGIIQSFSDFIKLISKEGIYPLMSNKFMYSIFPMINFSFSLFIWVVIPLFSGLMNFSLGVLFIFCCSSMVVYTVIISGWSSNSNYSLIGCLRGVAQLVSYEVSFFLVLMSFLVFMSSLSLIDFYSFQSCVWFCFFSLPLMFVWYFCMLAETSRVPFDFAECESELVSGFNVEYSGLGFTYIFLGEYIMIVFMSMLFGIVFLGADFLNFFFFLLVVFTSFSLILVRGVLPRFRYDVLMKLCWQSFLPVSLNYLFFFFGLKIIFFVSLC